MRLIPAHAGKTKQFRVNLPVHSAHPRSRGENITIRPAGTSRIGSSPLTRGKRIAEIAQRRLCRLIPAHAGKTIRARPITAGPSAHPRSRGENDERYIPLIHERGSSPLTRGKRISYLSQGERRRLIPAHAGKTNTPHFFLATNNGSSPLTRGKLTRGCRTVYARGLIPAHAGKTSILRP